MDHSPKFLAIVEEAKPRVKEVSVDEIIERIARGDRFELIDVREESELAAGRIKGAKHLGKGVLERDIEKKVPDPDADIVLYCGGGYRSVLAADTLQRMGYRRVVSMAGGWREWKAKSGPTE